MPRWMSPLILGLLCVSGGCARPSALTGTSWTLATLQGGRVLAGAEVTLEFTARRLGGSGGCNRYGGSYRATATTFRAADDVSSTVMACETPVGVMDQEAAYLRALLRATSYRLVGDRLELRGDTGAVVLTFSR